jgi:hypothetical protein
VEPAAFAFLAAVRSAARCARLRTAAARDLRMFFLAEAILGTNYLWILGWFASGIESVETRRLRGESQGATTPLVLSGPHAIS